MSFKKSNYNTVVEQAKDTVPGFKVLTSYSLTVNPPKTKGFIHCVTPVEIETIRV